jgi:hypothetical protein
MKDSILDNIWVVEAPGPHFLSVRELGGYEFYWQKDPDGAIQFVARDGAEHTMYAIRQMNRDLFAFDMMLGDAIVSPLAKFAKAYKNG